MGKINSDRLRVIMKKFINIFGKKTIIVAAIISVALTIVMGLVHDKVYYRSPNHYVHSFGIPFSFIDYHGKFVSILKIDIRNISFNAVPLLIDSAIVMGLLLVGIYLVRRIRSIIIKKAF